MQYCILDSTSPYPSVKELTELYDSVGWSAYTKIPERLIPMVEGSRYLYTAREAITDGTGRLVGLVRAVGDGHSTEHAVALYKRYGYAPVEAAGCITLACYR